MYGSSPAESQPVAKKPEELLSPGVSGPEGNGQSNAAQTARKADAPQVPEDFWYYIDISG